MKTVKIVIGEAKSLEHAMEKAIAAAEDGLTTAENNYRATHNLSKLRFITLEVNIWSREQDWNYIFEADLEKL